MNYKICDDCNFIWFLKYNATCPNCKTGKEENEE
jgi:RNA polymerase subunit RPABC4/transcription elongation factor Spt4